MAAIAKPKRNGPHNGENTIHQLQSIFSKAFNITNVTVKIVLDPPIDAPVSLLTALTPFLFDIDFALL